MQSSPSSGASSLPQGIQYQLLFFLGSGKTKAFQGTSSCLRSHSLNICHVKVLLSQQGDNGQDLSPEGQGAPAWAGQRGRCVLLLAMVLSRGMGALERAVSSPVPPSPVSTGLLLGCSQLGFKRRKEKS